MLLTDRMPARRPSVRLRHSWLSLLLLGVLRTCLAVLSPADKEQLEALLQSSQPGLGELQKAGVILTCTPVGDDAQEQQCQRITLDGSGHTGELIGLSAVRFPALAEFEVHNTLLTGSLPANLDTPQLQVLSFKNNTQFRSSLPSEWGVSASQNASFPELEELILEHGMWEGELPAEWGGNSTFPKLITMIITGPTEVTPTDRGLKGGIPSEWLTPGSFPRLRSMDLSYNSLSGWVPSSLMGISEPGELDAPELFPDLDTIRVFQQWGSGMCAHVSSSADIPAVPRSLDLGDTSTPSSADILRYMKSQPPPALVASSDACDAKRVSDELLRAAAKQFAAKAEWLLADSDILLTSTPFVMFPSDKDGQAPQEVFIGLCDLPEMLSLADGLGFDVSSQNAACETTLNYCEWGGVTCEPMSANVKRIAIGSEAALQTVASTNDTAQPLRTGDDGSLAYLPNFSRTGALPSLESCFLGTEVWGSLPDSWARRSQLQSLKTVSLLGDNFIHALPQGWAGHSPSGIQLANLSVSTVSTIGCVPIGLQGQSVTSLKLVQAPSFDDFPSSQKALPCPLPPTLQDGHGTSDSGSAETYEAIKEMQELRIDGCSTVLDLASLGCSTTDGNQCPVQQPAGDCTVQLQSIDVAESNICGEGYLPTALGCPYCSGNAAGACQGSCEQPGQDRLCKWSRGVCDDKMVQLIAAKAFLHKSMFTLVVPAAAREIPSGAYVLALSAAIAAGAEDLGSRVVGRPHVQGLVVASDRPECSPDSKMIVASLDGIEQELPNSKQLSDALSRPSLLLTPVRCGGGKSLENLQASQLALPSPPGIPSTHVLVEVDSVDCSPGANCVEAGRKLLGSDPDLLKPILQHPTTQQAFMSALEELSGSKKLGVSVGRLSASELLPQEFVSVAEQPEDRKMRRVMVASIAGGMTALLALLCCGCMCMQRRKSRTPQPSVDQYVGLSESRALPYATSAGASPTGTPHQGNGVRPEAVQNKMSWLKQLAGRKREQGSSQNRAVWTKFDHLLSVMTCASRLPADVSPEDAQVQGRRSTPGEMVAVAMRDSFVEKPQLALGKTMDIGPAQQNLSPTLPSADAIAKEMAANKEALASLVLRGPDAKKHAALRVASAYDSLFSDDPFGIYRTSPFQTPLWEMLLSHRGEEGPFKEHMLPARRFHCVGKGGFENGVAELQELQKNRLAVIHEFRSVMSSDPLMMGLKLQRASTSGVPLSASSLHPGTPLVHVDEERAFDGQDHSDNSHGEDESVRAGSMNMSMNMSTQLSAVPSGMTPSATAPPGRIPSTSLGSGVLPANRAQSTTPPSKLPRHIMIGESGPLSEDKVNQREKQYLDIIGQSSFPGQLPRPGSATLPSSSTPELPLVPTSISHTDEPVTVTHDSTDTPGLPELPRIGVDTAGRASTPSTCISRSFSWPYCQSLASMDFQALARDEDGFLRTSTTKEDGKSLDHGLFLGTDPRHPTVLLGSVYFVGDRQKARLNKGAENANAPYKPPDRVMGAPQPSTELPTAVTAAVAAAQSRRMARTGKVQSATDRIPVDTTADINRIAAQAAQEMCRGGGGDSHSSLTTPPSRSATMQFGGVSGHMATDEQVTTHTGLLAKLSNDFANRDQKAGHQVYIPPDGLEDSTTGLQGLQGLQTPATSQRVEPQDDAALIQQALQMCDTDKIRDSIGATAGVAWGAAPVRDTTAATPPGPGGYMKLEDVMNGTVPSESGAPYPVSGGPQAAIEPPDKVSVRYDQHSEAGIDTAFNVLLECFGMMQWQGPAKDIAVSMLEDLKSHVSAQHENRSIFDERLDLADLDMTSFRADEELGTDIVEPPAAQAEDRNKNAHLGLGLGKLTPLAEDRESDEGEGNNEGSNTQVSGPVVPLPPRMPGPPDKDMCIEPSKLTYISLLGRGAFGEVHYGTWEAPDGQVHDVAIKVLLATRYGNLEECEKDRQKFVREMQLMMRMTHHSIVRCFGGAMAKHDGEADFMVLEYIPGGTLDHYVHEHRRNSRLTLGEVLVIATDLADVLRYLHKLGVVHQDLKPSNILLNEHGEVKLTDFGISKIKRSTCLSQCMVGTPSYTAPEVWVGDQVNEKCDIFALGILLWECMTGTRPFKNMHAFQIMMHLQTNQKRGEDWLPFPKQTPPEFKRLVRRCWHAENRFRISADEALASAVLLRSTITDATQSVPVELDVGLLPDNHTQGVLIPSNNISLKGRNKSKGGRKTSPNASPQVSGGVNSRPHLSQDPGISRSRNAARPMKPDRSRVYNRGESNVYVPPSSPTRSRDASGNRLQIAPGQAHSSSETDSVSRSSPNRSPQPGLNPAELCGQSTGKASWAEAWSIEDSNSRAVQPMWHIGFGGDTTSNLGHGSNLGAGLDSGMSGGHRSGLSNARLMQQGSASSSAQARPCGGPSRMPAVLESGQQESAGSRDLDTQSSNTNAKGSDAVQRRPTSAEMESAQPHAKRQASNVNVQMANLSPLDPGAGAAPKPTVGSPLGAPSQTQAPEPRSLLGPSRAKTPEERCVPPTEEVHLPMPVPSAQHSTIVATESAALHSHPASGQLSHTRPLPQPFVGMGTSMAKSGRGNLPWNPTTTNTVTDVTLQPSMIDENSRQALATVPGPSLADAWKVAQGGGA